MKTLRDTTKPRFCQILYYHGYRVLGLPAEEDWPESVTLPWNSFKPLPPRPLESLIPEIDADAKDLLEVHVTNSVV